MQFNPDENLKKLAAIMALPADPKMSEAINAMTKGKNFLQQLHDEAFKAGFEKGLQANNDVDNIYKDGERS